jgi:hypothetical protein
MDDGISDERLVQLIALMGAGDAFYDILAALRELQDRRRKEQQEPHGRADQARGRDNPLHVPHCPEDP